MRNATGRVSLFYKLIVGTDGSSNDFNALTRVICVSFL
jgi:hypothetical protein